MSWELHSMLADSVHASEVDRNLPVGLYPQISAKAIFKLSENIMIYEFTVP